MESSNPPRVGGPLYRGPLRDGGGTLRALSEGERPIGGGTDLLPLLRDGRLAPTFLADIRATDGLATIDLEIDGSMTIGAGVTLSAIARHPEVKHRYPALVQACEAVGSLQLRNMGTIGGNLCQRPRCRYFRHGHDCLKAGGDHCPAVEGENAYHAAFREAACVAAHPSDPAVALTALEAAVELQGPLGARSVPISAFFDPGHPDRETVLAPDEYVRAIRLGASAAGGVQRFDKVMQRAAWDFALVSLCALRRPDGGVRLVLGGVAGRPFRVSTSVEEDVASGGLAPEDVDTLAERALYDATPLSQNGYKVEIAATLLRRGIAAIDPSASHPSTDH